MDKFEKDMHQLSAALDKYGLSCESKYVSFGKIKSSKVTSEKFVILNRC